MEKSIQNKKVIWAGRIISGVVGLMFVMSAVMKLTGNPEVPKGMDHLGVPTTLIMTVGMLELVCAIIYLVPMTAVLGAILLTGYLGGTILAHLRIGEMVGVQVALGVFAWAGLYLREPRLRALLPLRSTKA